MRTNNWFEVDKKGLQQLQEGKSKTFVIRELIQNALDENTSMCILKLAWAGRGRVTISCEDDSPEGFKDLTDAYTLYKHTYKRADANKRGRFNLGEKQVFAICSAAEVITTTGSIIFDDNGRRTNRRKRSQGSVINIELKMTREEFDECIEYANNIIIPDRFHLRVVWSDDPQAEFWHTQVVPYKSPYATFEATLKTEIEQDGLFKPTIRKTNVHLHKTNGPKYLYELGLPVCEIECDYSIDVQQKVPLSADRDSVVPSFLRDLYGEVLNHTIQDISEENISQTWIREAMDSDRVNPDTVVEVKEKRFGENAVIFNPTDPVANDEAVSKGYKLIYGSEMSANEWSKMKTHAGLVSSSKLFGYGIASDAVEIQWEKKHEKISSLTKRIAVTFLGIISVKVSFYKSKQATVLAQYGSHQLSYNTSRIPADWFEPDANGYVKEQMLDLIVHELAHEKGHHTEHSYHDCITKLAAQLTRKAIYDKNFFKIK